MNAMLEQMKLLPTVNLLIYLIGTLAVVISMGFLKGIKPAYIQLNEQRAEHRQLQRLANKFDISDLQRNIDEIVLQQDAVKESMLKDIPNRELKGSLPTLLETMHGFAKQHGLRTQQLRPGEITQNSDIATVPVSIVVVGPYQSIFTWVHDFTKNIEGISVADIRADKSPNSGGFRTMAMNLVIYGR